MNYKKGFLAIEWVAAFILILVGFALLLLIFMKFSNVDIDREGCRTSVISRATLPVFGKGFIPLNCQTKKICITGKLLGGKCEEYKNVKGVKTIRVGNSESGLNQIQKIYAEEITECWNTMGRGKVSLFSDASSNYFGVGKIYSTCLVCSRIAIDKSSLENVPFENINLQEYMMNYAVPGTEQTYFDYMLGKGYLPVSLQDDISIPNIVEGEENKIPIAKESGNLEQSNLENLMKDNKTPETAIVFMQITAPNNGRVLASTAATLAGVGVGASFVPGVKYAAKFVVTKIGAIPIAIAAVIGLTFQQGSISANRAIAASYCGDIEVGGDAREGCSSVRTLNYDLSSISEYCQVIEGYP